MLPTSDFSGPVGVYGSHHHPPAMPQTADDVTHGLFQRRTWV